MLFYLNAIVVFHFNVVFYPNFITTRRRTVRKTCHCASVEVEGRNVVPPKCRTVELALRFCRQWAIVYLRLLYEKWYEHELI